MTPGLGRSPGESESEMAQSCPTLWDPMDCSLPGASIHGIFQAGGLDWVAIFFSRGSSRPRGRTQVSRIVDRLFTEWATMEAGEGKGCPLYSGLWEFHRLHSHGAPKSDRTELLSLSNNIISSYYKNKNIYICI